MTWICEKEGFETTTITFDESLTGATLETVSLVEGNPVGPPLRFKPRFSRSIIGKQSKQFNDSQANTI